MYIVGVIPARYASKRFPGKVLALLYGKPILQWVWERISEVKSLNRLIIATDDERIFSVAKAFGAEVMMTSKKCRSGTDRVAEVAKKINADIIANIQGDEPLIKKQTVEKAIAALKNDSTAVMSTAGCWVRSKEAFLNPNIVKIVADKDNYALYFSRTAIPFVWKNVLPFKRGFLKHIGLYIYRRDFLLEFASLPQGRLEKIERLEQLRAIEYGYRIKLVIVKDNSLPVDTPDDLIKVENLVRKHKMLLKSKQ